MEPRNVIGNEKLRKKAPIELTSKSIRTTGNDHGSDPTIESAPSKTGIVTLKTQRHATNWAVRLTPIRSLLVGRRIDRIAPKTKAIVPA